jgi:hypothetical protein
VEVRRFFRVLLVLAFSGLVGVAANASWSFYGRSVPPLWVDPDAVVSGLGSTVPGLAWPDRVIAVDGKPLSARGGYRARAWDTALYQAAADHRLSVHVTFETRQGTHTLDLSLAPMGTAEWWMQSGATLFASVLYFWVAVIAAFKGRTGRAIAKHAFIAAIFIACIFDVQSTRILVPLWLLSFAMLPGSLLLLGFRLPKDVSLLRKHPWIIRILDGAGIVFALVGIGLRALGYTITPMMTFLSVSLAVTQIVFVTTYTVRYRRAKGLQKLWMGKFFATILVTHGLLFVGIACAMSDVSESVKVFARLTNLWMAAPGLALIVRYMYLRAHAALEARRKSLRETQAKMSELRKSLFIE